MGQFFTPYDVSRMMAEMTFDTVDEIIAEQGFVTVQEPACGAGGMIIAAADVIDAQGLRYRPAALCGCDRHFADVLQDVLPSGQLARHPRDDPARQHPQP